jgi:putative membrane protein
VKLVPRFHRLAAIIGLTTVLAALAMLSGGTAQASSAEPAAATAASQQDVTFLQNVRQINLFAIQAGNIAANKAVSEQVQGVAERLAASHTRLDLRVGRVANQLQVELLSAITEEQQSQVEQLNTASGREFDRVFISQQIVTQHQLLGLGVAEQRYGESRDARALATQVMTEARNNIAMLLRINPASS